MTQAYVFDGKVKAEKRKKSLQQNLDKLKTCPVLEVVAIGSDPISNGYLKELEKTASQVKVGLKIKRFSGETGFEKIKAFLEKENNNLEVNGILIEISARASLFDRREEIIKLVCLKKDADCLKGNCLPSVCRAVLLAIKKAGVVLSFRPEWVKVLVVGNQGFWGRRVQAALENEDFENVFGVDKETVNLKAESLKADIVISCVGKPELIKKNMVKKGAAVIDVGYSYKEDIDDMLVGDVDFAQVKKIAGFITPVPGGIGPLSTVLVFDNLVRKMTTSVIPG